MDRLMYQSKSIDYSSQKSNSGDGTFDDDAWMPTMTDNNPVMTATFSAEYLIKQITVKSSALQFTIEYKPVYGDWEKLNTV